MKSFPVIKDLVCDVSWNFEVNKKIPAFKMRRRTASRGSRRKKPTACRSSASASSASCARTSATCCATTTSNEEFGGPRFFVRVAGLEMHPLDDGDRLELLKDELGLGYCNITKCCTEVCPEHIKITDNAIIPLKERVVDQFYDPVKKLFRIVFPT